MSGDPLQWRVEELMGRFSDDPQALNFYSYSINNPIVLIDPDGEAFQANIEGSASLLFILNISLDLGIAFTDDGSISIVIGPNGGVSGPLTGGKVTPGLSGDIQVSGTFFKASEPERLKDPSVEFGAGGCYAVCAGSSIILNPNNPEESPGIKVNGGFGTPSVNVNAAASTEPYVFTLYSPEKSSNKTQELYNNDPNAPDFYGPKQLEKKSNPNEEERNKKTD